jgi:hypothetical protein
LRLGKIGQLPEQQFDAVEATKVLFSYELVLGKNNAKTAAGVLRSICYCKSAELIKHS